MKKKIFLICELFLFVALTIDVIVDEFDYQRLSWIVNMFIRLDLIGMYITATIRAFKTPSSNGGDNFLWRLIVLHVVKIPVFYLFLFMYDIAVFLCWYDVVKPMVNDWMITIIKMVCANTFTMEMEIPELCPS